MASLSLPTITPHATPNAKRSSKTASRESLNHLTNFSLPPRQPRALQSIPRRSRKTGTQHGVWNKEKFVNAQYRFIMKPSGDYTVHFADPDIYFQWTDILQVIVPRTSALAIAAGRTGYQDEGLITCPICLSLPTAPRMTKCGHIFCFPCVLHYLNTSDHANWNRCPICFDSIHEKQLKSVHWFDEPATVLDDDCNESSAETSSSVSGLEVTDTPQPGSVLHMRLMQRPSMTTLALPRSATWPSDLLSPHQAPFHFLPDVMRFAKFMLATPTYLVSELTRDLHELAAERSLLSRLGDELSQVFVDAAESKVKLQLQKADALDSTFLNDSIVKAQADLDKLLIREEQMRIRQRQFPETMTSSPNSPLALPSEIPEAFLATQDHSSSATTFPVTTTLSSATKTKRPKRNPPPPNPAYYYYQAASGASIFLHPLDIRILLAHFRQYSSFPSSINVRVEAADEGTVDDALRKRCKYLGNMPESADVVFIEANLEAVVGSEGLKPFESALTMRRRKRRDKVRKDDRAMMRAEEAEKETLWAGMDVARSVRYGIIANHEDDMSWADSIVADALRPSSPIELHPPTNPNPERNEHAGVWGRKSFASALHSTPSSQPESGGRNQNQAQGRRQQVGSTTQSRSQTQREREEQDEWDMTAAWHELEQTVQRGGGDKKKGGRKLVILGGGGRRR